MFSCFRRPLSIQDVGDVETMGQLIHKSYTPAPTIVHIGGPEAVANWSGLMKTGTYLHPGFRGIRSPAAFAFTRNADGDCEVLTKNHSSDADWLGLAGVSTPGLRSVASLHIVLSVPIDDMETLLTVCVRGLDLNGSRPFLRTAPTFDNLLELMPPSLRTVIAPVVLDALRTGVRTIVAANRMTEAAADICLERVRWADQKEWAGRWPQSFHWADGGRGLLSVEGLVSPVSAGDNAGDAVEEGKEEAAAPHFVARSSLHVERHRKYRLIDGEMELGVGHMAVVNVELDQQVQQTPGGEEWLSRFWIGRILAIEGRNLRVAWLLLCSCLHQSVPFLWKRVRPIVICSFVCTGGCLSLRSLVTVTMR